MKGHRQRMNTTNELVVRKGLTADQYARLAPEILVLRDGLVELATGLVNAYPSDTHVLRVTAPLTRAADGLFAAIARLAEESGHGDICSAAHVEQAQSRLFYAWARHLREQAGSRLWMVPKLGLTGEEHVQLAQEVAACRLAVNRLMYEMQLIQGAEEIGKTARSLRGAIVAYPVIWSSV